MRHRLFGSLAWSAHALRLFQAAQKGLEAPAPGHTPTSPCPRPRPVDSGSDAVVNPDLYDDTMILCSTFEARTAARGFCMSYDTKPCLLGSYCKPCKSHKYHLKGSGSSRLCAVPAACPKWLKRSDASLRSCTFQYAATAEDA